MKADDHPPRKLPQLMKIDEVAEMLRLKKGTIYHLVARKAIPYHKPGGSLRFDMDEIVEWMKKDREK